jgi:hypothetical protein
MVKGFKDGDSKIMVAPGAFQADTPDVPPQGDGISWDDKYAGTLSLSSPPRYHPPPIALSINTLLYRIPYFSYCFGEH